MAKGVSGRGKKGRGGGGGGGGGKEQETHLLSTQEKYQSVASLLDFLDFRSRCCFC